MKEVKEVVHVPTRELAEEVLRVAKENGYNTAPLDKDIKGNHYKENLCLELKPMSEISLFADIEYFEDHEYSIISAQEFLNRYKPKFRPIAMRCNKEQFEAVKGKLVGCCLVGVSNFTKNIYLVNNFLGAKLNISNVTYPSVNDRQVFEEWNEKTFLEYCGIQVKDEVSELEKLRKENEELKKHYNNVEHELKQLNNELSKELGLVKQQLKAIEDQPKVGDVCLFWDDGDICFTTAKVVNLNKDRQYKYASSNGGVFENCIKATPENIQAKIKELQDE